MVMPPHPEVALILRQVLMCAGVVMTPFLCALGVCARCVQGVCITCVH